MRLPPAAFIPLFGACTCVGAQIAPQAAGTVESVREAPLETLEHGVAAALEHAVRPPGEVVVRLDDGRVVTLVQDAAEPHSFAPGEPVWVGATPRWRGSPVRITGLSHWKERTP